MREFSTIRFFNKKKKLFINHSIVISPHYVLTTTTSMNNVTMTKYIPEQGLLRTCLMDHL